MIKSQPNSQYSIFLSSGFLIGLAVLFLNDFILKTQFHNWLTGKLSDFAGLFVFALFWSAFFPRKSKSVHILVAVFFIFWKSPLSEPLIQIINATTFLNYARVVDWTDLAALVMLPLAYWYQYVNHKEWVKMPAIVPICFASFLFIATSEEGFYQGIVLDESYELAFPQDSLFKRLNRIDSVEANATGSVSGDSTFLSISFYSFACEQRMHIESSSQRLTDSTCLLSFLTVYENENCYKVADPKKVEQSIQNLRDELEDEIIDKLQ